VSHEPTPRLDVDELCELRPTAQILERLALQDGPEFDAAAVARLRAANRRLGQAAHDPDRAVVADHHLRSLLTERCPDRRLLALLAEVRVALLAYRRAGLTPAARVLARCAEHHGVIDAVERGDNRRAGRLLAESTARELGSLVEALQRGWRPSVAAS
jgi:DNA-binding GntR family transcriptional regulator